MPKSRPYVVIAKESKTELQQFASWFHQDWKLMFKDFHEGARIYISTLSPERRQALRRELGDFIEASRTKSPEEIKQLWLKLGAEGWQQNLDIRQTLAEFLNML